MREILMSEGDDGSFREVYEEFVISRIAKGVPDTAIAYYHYRLNSIAIKAVANP